MSKLIPKCSLIEVNQIRRCGNSVSFFVYFLSVELKQKEEEEGEGGEVEVVEEETTVV